MVRYKVLASLIVSAIVLLLPKSASAIETQLTSVGNPNIVCFYLNGTYNDTHNDRCTFDTSTGIGNGIRYIYVYDNNRNISVSEGEVVEILYTMRSNQIPSNIAYRFADISAPGYELIDFEVNQVGGSQVSYHDNPTTNVISTDFSYGGLSSVFSKFTYQCTTKGGCKGPFSLAPTTGTFLSFSQFGSPGQGGTVQVTSINYLQLVDTNSESEVADKELEGQDNIEGQDTSGNNQGVSDDNYSSLLDIFSGFITAITNVSGGSCTISLNTDFANLGEVDLCTYDPPSYIQIIGSIILILLFVPLSMALIKRILKTIQELQQ